MCVSSNGYSEYYYLIMPSNNGCIDKVFSPVCVLRCFVSFLFYDKTFLQWLHLYGFSSVCVFGWFKRLLFSEKALPHWLHQYGFPPVWVFWCVINPLFCEKAISHWLNWYDSFHVCVSSNGSSEYHYLKRPSNNGCIDKVFPQCVSSDDL